MRELFKGNNRKEDQMSPGKRDKGKKEVRKPKKKKKKGEEK
jgi:hypothetical protein